MPASTDCAPEARPDLQSLRAEIDRIDAALLDLIEERLTCARAIAGIKGSKNGAELRVRPAREQQVIERLVRRAGQMPPSAVTVIWRELMGVSLQAQQETCIVIHSPGQPVLVTDQARRRFGGAAPIVSAGAPQEALGRARDHEAIAVIEFSPLSNWWVELFHDSVLTIFDCLRDRHGRIVALVVGRLAATHSSADTSFLVLGEGPLRRRMVAGEPLRTLAMCGKLRLCAIESPATSDVKREAA